MTFSGSLPSDVLWKFAKWLYNQYGEHGKSKIYHGKVHGYLGMRLDFSEKKKFKFDM